MSKTRSRWRRFQRWLASWLLFVVVRMLGATYRYRVFGAEHRSAAAALHPSGSFCLALWHEHLFASILAHSGQKFAPLASLSEDGDLVTFVMDRIGFKTIRGSSSRRGEEARHDMVGALAGGWFTAITMDGPRGPRRRLKGGIVDVARRGNVAILPLITIADRQWVLTRSWDQFKIPKPFARVAVQYGAPLVVPAETQGLAFGEAKNKVKDAMTATESDATRALAAWSASRDDGHDS